MRIFGKIVRTEYLNAIFGSRSGSKVEKASKKERNSIRENKGANTRKIQGKKKETVCAGRERMELPVVILCNGKLISNN